MLQFLLMPSIYETLLGKHHEGNGRVFLPKDLRKGWQPEELTPELLAAVFGPDWKQSIEDKLKKRHLVRPGTKIPWEEQLKPHDGSYLFYAIDKWKTEGQIVYVQVSPPGSKSTIHWHVYPEYYEAMKGNAIVAEDRGIITIPEGMSHTVPAGMIHQARAPRNTWSLVFLQGINGANISEDKRYINRRQARRYVPLLAR